MQIWRAIAQLLIRLPSEGLAVLSHMIQDGFKLSATTMKNLVKAFPLGEEAAAAGKKPSFEWPDVADKFTSAQLELCNLALRYTFEACPDDGIRILTNPTVQAIGTAVGARVVPVIATVAKSRILAKGRSREQGSAHAIFLEHFTCCFQRR